MPKAGQSMPLDARLQVSPDKICQANWSSGVEAIEALRARVSGTTLIEPGPDELELHSILSAAVRAPDHGRLRPWRFTVLRGAARHRLGELMGKALVHRHADATAAQIEKERTKPLRAPLILVVAAKVDEQCKIPAIEKGL